MSELKNTYEIIVIGGGHAGCEACLAGARMGLSTLLITMDLEKIGYMSCNPAIGGVGKGQLVKEIDALGGEMGKAADYAGIQFRQLNSSKGPAVRSSRAQIDRRNYLQYMQTRLSKQKNLDLMQAQVSGLIIKNNSITGITTIEKNEIFAESVIITPGTFLNGLIHIGLDHFPGGRLGDEAAIQLSHDLKKAGFTILRFKTGTCARLDSQTIDFDRMEKQNGDSEPKPFSFSTEKIDRNQVPCYITHTNEKTHRIIKGNLDRSPLFSGVIESTGVRYCPSIEDKIVKFAHKNSHQIFLEPEGLNVPDYYPNGLSSSLPEDVQEAVIHSIQGLEKAKILKIGYGIERDVIDPTQLYATMETKKIQNLYFAGQINGTTGYEEAAAQGLLAGINAALKIRQMPPLILDRSRSYIGVLLDDLVTVGTREPYRMFTSRVEYRLLVREDNADSRLREIGYKIGLVEKADYEKILDKNKKIQEMSQYLAANKIQPSALTNEKLNKLNLSPLNQSVTLDKFLRRPEIKMHHLQLLELIPAGYSQNILTQTELEIKYRFYIEKQLNDLKQFDNLEKIKIPAEYDYSKISGLSFEIIEKLSKIRPLTLGQAKRISGVTPAAIMILIVYLKK